MAPGADYTRFRGFGKPHTCAMTVCQFLKGWYTLACHLNRWTAQWGLV